MLVVVFRVQVSGTSGILIRSRAVDSFIVIMTFYRKKSNTMFSIAFMISQINTTKLKNKLHACFANWEAMSPTTVRLDLDWQTLHNVVLLLHCQASNFLEEIQ